MWSIQHEINYQIWVAQNFQRTLMQIHAWYMWYVKYLHGLRFKNLVTYKCMGKFESWNKPGLFFFVNWTLGQVGEERQGFLTIERGLFFLSSLVAKQIKLHNFVDFNMMDPILSSYVWAIRCLQAHNSHPPKHTQNPIWFWILYTSYGLVKVHPMLGLPFQPWAVGSTSCTRASPSTTIALVYNPKIWKDNKGKRFLANFKQCGPMWAT